jgi:dTDP-glucose 4,6-dehydratase
MAQLHRQRPRVLVTGGAGFIGGNFLHFLLGGNQAVVANLDLLTYAGHRATVADLESNPSYTFVHGDIADRALVRALLGEFKPNWIVNFAAESHVDRSIDGPAAFVHTNVVGTLALLEEALAWQRVRPEAKQPEFRFLHVSTDEVYGTLGATGAFDETTRYAPNSPYAASKAASDHLVRAWHHTYGLPALITNCSNNYGPYQYPEKLIPLTIRKALAGQPLPIYGTGGNVRDWLYVEDHCRALWQVLQHGRPGEIYNVGGRAERTNLEVVDTLCTLLDQLLPDSPFRPHARLKTFVADRPAHDWRYAIDPSKIERELGWRAEVGFADGLELTVRWYLANQPWCEAVSSGVDPGERRGLETSASAGAL